MPKRPIDWLGLLSAFVQDHPKTSAMVAFNLGVLAANAAKKAKGAMPSLPEMTEIPSKLIDLVPSIGDMKLYAPALAAVQSPSRGRASPSRPRARKTRKKTARRRTRAKAA
jgi:hypothetical protein